MGNRNFWENLFDQAYVLRFYSFKIKIEKNIKIKSSSKNFKSQNFTHLEINKHNKIIINNKVINNKIIIK